MKRLEEQLVQVQLVIAAAMAGIIWFVQRITYPQFLDVGATDFAAFHERYTTSLAPLIAPLMIAELGLSLLSIYWFWRTDLRTPIIAAALLTGLLWLSTFLIQVPLHDRLARGWSEAEIQHLINSNWIRTLLWSARLGLLALITFKLAVIRSGARSRAINEAPPTRS